MNVSGYNLTMKQFFFEDAVVVVTAVASSSAFLFVLSAAFLTVVSFDQISVTFNFNMKYLIDCCKKHSILVHTQYLVHKRTNIASVFINSHYCRDDNFLNQEFFLIRNYFLFSIDGPCLDKTPWSSCMNSSIKLIGFPNKLLEVKFDFELNCYPILGQFRNNNA